MDLTMKTSAGKLNLRTAVIIKRGPHYLIHKGKHEKFATLIGGRIQFGEDSRTAIMREIKEEINLEIDAQQLEFISTFENFYRYKGEFIHEILFIYKLEVTDELGDAMILEQPDETFDFYFAEESQLFAPEFKPDIMKEVLYHCSNHHLIHYDDNIKDNNKARG